MRVLQIKFLIYRSTRLIKCFFILVYEIWGFMKFNEKCHENLKRSEDMLRNMDEHKANMTRTLTNINKLESDLDQVRSELLIYLPYSTKSKA